VCPFFVIVVSKRLKIFVSLRLCAQKKTKQPIFLLSISHNSMPDKPLKPYSLLSDEEPTDVQLEELMRCVLEDVKARAAAADEKYKKMQEEEYGKIRLLRQQKSASNE
jgi:hypothetical protein